MVRGYIISGFIAVALLTVAMIFVDLSAEITQRAFTISSQCESFIHIPTLGRIHISREILGAGAFSLVLTGRAMDIEPRMDVAVKIGISDHAGIDADTKILTALNGTANFPNYFGTTTVRCNRGEQTHTYPALVMELLGDSVDIFARKVELKSGAYRVRKALEIGRGVLDGVERLHRDFGIIMHDIYARNIVLSRDSDVSVPRLIDFGESLNFQTDGARDYKTLNRLYTSIREDRNEPLGPRDDLERIVYLMVHVVLGGEMPWASDDGDWVVYRKASMNPKIVCNILPKEIAQILVYARSGIENATSLPDYNFVRKLIDTALLGLDDKLTLTITDLTNIV